ncbi:nitrous oxide reductase family maturation protein NosD [Halalkalirubrum salinum]|uniref:nitrous oxide reductase family maturation protein NosD n=1 Tax=Halalkalirubrum salinum TaxID=2563889 RepID=UPI0010FB243E|nr:nitrous oxide reductase family maturation protein NosD [Halalkalirubrum salinum]
MHNTATEIGFLALACAIVLVAVAVPFVAATPDAEPMDPTAAADFAPGTAAAEVTAPDAAGTATINGETYESVSAAIDAAEPGDTVVLTGRFDERVNVSVDDLTIVADESGAVIDGGDEGRVVTISGENVTVSGVWVRGSGTDLTEEDAGIFIAGDGATIETVRVSDSAFGIWIDGADRATIADVRIDGQSDVHPVTERGNGIQLFETSDTVVRDSEITDTRDGLYFSWASNVTAENNTMWNTRYGVHYMYSDGNRLVNNTAVDNGVGYALMVSDELVVKNNTAVRNTDTSGHGILAKDIERSALTNNTIVDNKNGLYAYNAQHNRITDNLVLGNDIGIHSSAGSSGQTLAGNSFVENGRAVAVSTGKLHQWNDTDRGNYWSDARILDRNGDGTSEIRHRPAGLVEHLIAEYPQAAIFADSPAFEAVRMAESSFPIVDSPGVVDHHPLTEPPHDWKRYVAKEPTSHET